MRRLGIVKICTRATGCYLKMQANPPIAQVPAWGHKYQATHVGLVPLGEFLLQSFDVCLQLFLTVYCQFGTSLAFIASLPPPLFLFLTSVPPNGLEKQHWPLPLLSSKISRETSDAEKVILILRGCHDSSRVSGDTVPMSNV